MDLLSKKYEQAKLIEELKAENTELGKIIECKNGTIATLANIRDRLKAENERLKQTLQEIKAIVCGNYEIIDPQGRKDILKLITKSEEE